ncbi:MAG: metallophosphoesterase family protein [Treponema sp.]
MQKATTTAKNGTTRRLGAWAAAFFILVLSGCGLNSYGLNEFLVRNPDVKTRTKRLEKLSSTDAPTVTPDSDGKYRVLVITDVHFGAEKLPKNGPRYDDEFFTWLNTFTPKPQFCVGLGDMAEHGWEEEFERYKAFTDRLESAHGIKTFNAVGNHDLYNSGWTYCKEYLYPFKALYYFEAGGFSWYFIDTASGSLGATQMRLLRKTMQSDPKPKVVMSHFPLWANGHFYFSLQDSLERNVLIANFAENGVKAALTGHTHVEKTAGFGRFTEYNHPGFYAKAGWGIITVDPVKQTVRSEIYYLPVSRALGVRFPSRALCYDGQNAPFTDSAAESR